MTNRFIDVVDCERGILLDKTVGPLAELTHQRVAPPLRHVAMSVVPSSLPYQQSKI